MYDNRSASAARPHGARRRRVLSLVAGCALALTTGAVVWGSTTSAAAPSEKIRICHATNAEDNPYRSIEVDKAGGANGHIDHIGPVFQPGMKDDGIVWGDIIPEFTFEGETFSLNWTEEGIAIWEHGCAVPATVDVCPNIPGDQAEPPEGMVIDPETGDCVDDAGTAGDVCPNIPGEQTEPPPGMVIDPDTGECVETGSGGSTPSPDPGDGGGSGGGTGSASSGSGSAPGAGPETRVEAGAPLAGGGGSAGAAPQGPAAAAPGSEAVPPSAVDAGLGPASTVSDPAVLARGLVGLGLALMIAAGLVGLGGRRRGVDQA